MYLSGTTYTDADFTKAIQSLHGIAASIADSKQRYQQTGDVRYLQSVQTMIPYMQQGIQKANEINRALSGQDMPSDFDVFLADSLSWLTDAIAAAGTVAKNVIVATGDTVKQVPKAVGNIFSIPVLLAIGAVAFMAFGGGRFLPRRKS